MLKLIYFLSITFLLIFSSNAFSQSSPTNIAISESSINENEAIGTLVGILSASDADGDADTFELVSGTGDTNNSSFTIDNSNVLVSSEIFDHETKSTYNVRVRVSDQTDNTYEEAFLITISNVNEAPIGFGFNTAQLSFVEGQLPGHKVVRLSASDPDVGDTFRYELVDGEGSDDNSNFDITGDQIDGYDLIILESPDFETKASYNIRLAVFDELGESYEEALKVNVRDNQNAFSEWVVSGTLNGGLDRVYTSRIGVNDEFFVSGSVAGKVSLDENTTVEDEGFIAIYDENLVFSNVIRYGDISNEFISVDEVFEIEFEDNGDIYLLANVTSITSFSTHIIKLNDDFKVLWRFDVSERFDGSIEYLRGNFSVNNGMIAFARKIRGLSGRYYFGLVGSNGSNSTGPDFTNTQDQSYVALIDTSGVAQWIDFNISAIQFSHYVADIELQSNKIHIFYNNQNQYKFLVIDFDRTTIFEKTITPSMVGVYRQNKFAIDTDGDIYITGAVGSSNPSQGTVTIEGAVYTTAVSEANFLVKYSSDGVPQFVKLIDVSGTDSDFIDYVDMVATSDGLHFYGNNRHDQLTYEGVTYDLGSPNSAFILKLAPDGSFSDIYNVGGDAAMFTKGFGVTTSNEVLFAGEFRGGSVEIGGNTFTNNLYPKISDYDIYFGKLSENFDALTAESLGNKGGDIKWRDASQTEDGMIYGFGDFVGEITIGETTLYSEDRDMVIATFNKDETITDIQHIENNFTDEYAERIEAFTYEELGTGLIKKSYYLVGRGEADQSLDFNGTNLIPNSGTFLVQLNENYFGLWSTSFGDLSGAKTSLDTDNQIYISGTFGSSGLDIEGNEVANMAPHRNSVLINYSVDGSLDWYKAQVIQKNVEVGEPSIIDSQLYLPMHVVGADPATLVQDNIDITWPNTASTYWGTVLTYDLDGNGEWGMVLNGENNSIYSIPSVYQTPSGNIGFSMFNDFTELDNTGNTILSSTEHTNLDYVTITKKAGDYLFAYGYNSPIFGTSTIVSYDNEYNQTFIDRHALVSSSNILKTKDLFINSSLDSVFVFGEYGLNLLTINSGPESIILSTTDVEENLISGTFISTLGAEDNNQMSGFEFQVLDNSNYTIREDSLFVLQSFNFEQQNESQSKLKIRAEDGGGATITQQINMNIVDANDPPTDLSFGVEFADERSYGPNGASISGLQTRELLPLDSAISIFTALDEDANETLVYSLVTDSIGFEDHIYFKFNADTLQVADTLDYEFIEARETVATEGFYSLLVKVTDSAGDSIFRELRIGLGNEDEPPSGLQLNVTFNSGNGNQTVYDSFPENSNSQFFVEPLDPDLGAFSSDLIYSIDLVAGLGDEDNLKMIVADSINLNGRSAQLRPNPEAPYFGILNFEEDSILNLRLGFYNHDSTFYQEFPVSIPIIDMNDKTDSIAIVGLGEYSIQENIPIGTRLGLVKAIDEDKKSIFRQNEVTIAETTYSYLLEIDENDSLLIASEINKEQNNRILFYFESFDNQSLSTEIFETIIEIEDINEAPEITIPTELAQINENDPGFNLLNWNTTYFDPEGDAITVELVAGEGDEDNTSFEISQTNSRPVPVIEFNHEEKDTVSIRIRASDPKGLFDEEVIKIRIEDRNDFPINILLDNQEVLENLPANTVVGTFSAEDEDENDSHVFQFSNGNESDFFTISGNQLLTSGVLDFESNETFSILVTTSDLEQQNTGGVTSDYQFEINILDEDEEVVLSNSSIAESSEIGTEVGVLSIGSREGLAFELVTFSGETDNESFTIDGDQLLTSEIFDFETKSFYTLFIQAIGEESTLTTLEVTVTDITEEVALAISPISEISIYPNPSFDFITITSDKYQNADIEIVNLTGQVLLEKSQYQLGEQIDISELSVGVYFITLRKGKDTIRQKLIKQ